MKDIAVVPVKLSVEADIVPPINGNLQPIQTFLLLVEFPIGNRPSTFPKVIDAVKTI